MEQYVNKIMKMMKDEKLFAPQGGPIILAQIENEYNQIQLAYRELGDTYVQWAAKLAVGQNIRVPWIMCKQKDAPDPVYHGGTNFGRTSVVFTTTRYYDEAPLDEYALQRDPKWSHLKDLHKAINLCKKTLLTGTPGDQRLGEETEVRFYEKPGTECAAFIANNHSTMEATVNWRGQKFLLPPASISILPDCKTVVFNTQQMDEWINILKKKLINI
ncbi:putative beta-galactosidase [Rosa chinensis]|uniref:beta-galactosidase n=1 Tax=Rosa chinensis TaxID=74649 RepID=A0A2P6Q991_ROSCH|nr:putative beta-galactosidase [Rosa chinensis]